MREFQTSIREGEDLNPADTFLLKGREINDVKKVLGIIGGSSAAILTLNLGKIIPIIDPLIGRVMRISEAISKESPTSELGVGTVVIAGIVICGICGGYLSNLVPNTALDELDGLENTLKK